MTAVPTPNRSPTPRQPISQRQNDDDMMDLLCASTLFYGRAKRWHLVRVVGTIGLALAAPIITFWAQDAAEVVAAVAALWVLAGRTVLGRLEEAAMRQGVTAQEQFDTELFGLPWHDALAGRPLAQEDVIHAAARIKPKVRAAKRDWYPDTDRAPWPLNVVLCQRASAAWSRRAHERYAVALIVAASAWFVAGIFMGIVANITLGDYLIKIFLPSQPAFLDAIELVRAHRIASAEKERVEVMADDLWARGVADLSAVTVAGCRTVQDHVYRLRRCSPQVAEWYYRINRRRDDEAMRRAADRKIGEL